MSLFDKAKFHRIKENKKTEKKHTIMIVDDEECNLKALVSLLSEDYNIITAMDGQEAFEYIQKRGQSEKISLIISDQRMPRLTGIQLFEKVKGIIPNTIRIILTAYKDTDINDSEKEKALISQIIFKPFDPDGLKEQIRCSIKEFECREKNKGEKK